jgi:DNA (cytosine-5)-methyltransferase 1
MTYKFIDLFSGTGGFSYCLEKHGFKCVFSNDNNKNSKLIYNLNHDSKFVLKDILDVDVEDIPSHDILCGGFPCQPFSVAGKRKGFDDERSNVFWKILEIIEHHNPQIVILENVKNLLTHDKGNTIETIENSLIEKGYFLKYKVLDTSKLTVIPQHRERIYIVCFKDKEKYEKFNFDFKRVKNLKIREFLEDDIDSKYYYSSRLKVFDIIEEGVKKHINENVLYQFRRQYVRENKSNCCPTLTANMGGGGHNVPLLLDDVGIRKLTPRECFNLQGFPIDYKLPDISDSQLYKLAGNAISIPILDLIIEKIKFL